MDFLQTRGKRALFINLFYFKAALTFFRTDLLITETTKKQERCLCCVFELERKKEDASVNFFKIRLYRNRVGT